MEFKVKESRDMFGERRRILVIGGPKVGKTVLCATLSDNCPKELPHKGDTISLDDMLYLNFDGQGVESLLPLGLSAPTIDLSECATLKDLKQGMKFALQVVKERVAQGKTKIVVVDPISTLDVLLVTHYRNLYPDPKESGMLWNSVLNEHINFAIPLFKSIPCDLIITCHVKMAHGMLGNDSATIAKDKQVTSLPGNAEVIPAITGAALKFYRAQVSWILPILCEKRKGHEERFVLPYGGRGYEGGGRYPGLEEKEDANLGELFKKIKGNK